MTAKMSHRTWFSSARVTSTALSTSPGLSDSSAPITASTEAPRLLAIRAFMSNSAVAALCARRSVPSTTITSQCRAISP